jgi:hypothetical protein
MRRVAPLPALAVLRSLAMSGGARAAGRRALPLGAVLAGLLASTAEAHVPPQVYLRQLDVSDRPTGAWIPLRGAHVASVNGYEIGVRLETSGEHVLAEMTTQPRGALAQRDIYSLCFQQTGKPGSIKDIDERIHYAGNGTYGLKVTASESPDASSACRTANAATSIGTFTVHGAMKMTRVGRRPLILDSLARKPQFAGWRIDAPPLSHFPEVSCARNAHVRPDGTLRGTQRTTIAADHDRRVPRAAFFAPATSLPGPGIWTCVAQASNGSAFVKPPPTHTRPEFVRERWYGLDHLFLTDGRGPAFAIRGEAPEAARGGRITLRLTRRVCGERPRKGPTVHGTVSRRTGRVSLHFRLPRLKGQETVALYTATTTISGARAIVGRRRDLGASLELSRSGRRGSVLHGSLSNCAYR